MFDPVKSWIDKLIQKKLFGGDEPVEGRMGSKKVMSSLKGHSRSQAERRVRRQSHRDKLRTIQARG